MIYRYVGQYTGGVQYKRGMGSFFTYCMSHHHISQLSITEPPQNPGNIKYVLCMDGHWFMEIDRNCLKHTGKRWDLPKLAIPLFKVIVIIISLISTLAIPTQIGR